MGKLTREYYPITKAAELLDFDLAELLHRGACGSLPVYVKPKNWSGVIFNPYNCVDKGDGSYLANPPEPCTISVLTQGRLYRGTMEQFDFGEEAVTVKSLQQLPDSDPEKPRQFDLDIPVVIKASDLYVFTKDIQDFPVDATPNDEQPKVRNASPKALSALSQSKGDEITLGSTPFSPTETMTIVNNNDSTFLRIGQVEEITCMSRKTIYPKIKKGEFPKQHKQGGTNISVWVASEIYAYNDSHITKPRNTKAKT